VGHVQPHIPPLTVRLGDDLQVLRRRDFRLLFLGQGVSVFGDRMVVVALAFAVIHLGGSESEVGLVLAAGWAPLVLTVLAGGVIADRTSRRAVMVTADLARILSQGTMAVLVITGAADVWMLAALAGVTGAATGLFNPASTGLLPEVVPDEELQPANALRSAAQSGSEILGPALAGVLVATVGAGSAIAVDAATFAISAVCLALLRPPAREQAARGSFLADLREGWVAFRSRRWVWTVVACTAVVNMAWGAWSALGPTVAERDLGGAWRVVGGGEVAAQDRRDAKDAQEVLRHVGARIALRLPVDGRVDGRSIEVGGEPLEGALLRPQLVVVHRRHLPVDAEEGRRRRIDEVDADQPLGVGKRKAAQHHAVDDAEHGRHTTNPKGEDDHGEGTEGLLLHEHAKADADVTNQVFEHGFAT